MGHDQFVSEREVRLEPSHHYLVTFGKVLYLVEALNRHYMYLFLGFSNVLVAPLLDICFSIDSRPSLRQQNKSVSPV